MISRYFVKKIILISSFAFISAAGLYAAEVSLSDVNRVAEVCMKVGEEVRSSSLALPPVYYSVKDIGLLTREEQGSILAYIVELKPKGFIVVSCDDNIEPVIAYSFSGDFSFSEGNENILFHMIKKDVGNRIKAIPLLSDKIKKNNKQLWARYVSDYSFINELQAATQWPADDDTGWIDTTWHQGYPYYNFCPKDPVSGQRCVVGCAATAMAQVVNYHKYPGSISFNSSDEYSTLGLFTSVINIDDDSATLDFPAFSELSSKLSGIEYSNSSESHAPALSFACGVILQMEFSSSQSGAHLYAENFTEKLKYKDAQKLTGDTTGFYTILEDDMKNERPALLAVYTDTTPFAAGHAIIADGYRSTGEYHLNYGWGNSSPDVIGSCWYSLPNNMPFGFTVIAYGILSITAPTTNPYNTYEDPIGYPNPFVLAEVAKVTIAMPSGESGFVDEVLIYTVSGQLVKKIKGGGFMVEWDGCNDSGKKCCTGLYFYSLRTTGKKIFRGKITIVN